LFTQESLDFDGENNENNLRNNRSSTAERRIRARLVSGSFNQISFISRDRWSQEEQEVLPIVKLPRKPLYTSPAEHPRLHVEFTDDYLLLQRSIDIETTEQLLTAPKTTWCMRGKEVSRSVVH